jgi:hypothetical protein
MPSQRKEATALLDTATSAEGARIEKYSAAQVAHSAALVGGEPTADELRAHHDAPEDGVLDLTGGTEGEA